jgi:cytochrome c556
VSARSVERALKIRKEGTPEDVQEVSAGKTTVKAKAREIAARTKAEPKPQGQSQAQPALSDDSVNAPVTLTFNDYDWERLRAMAKLWCVPVRSLAMQFVILQLTYQEERDEGRWSDR